MLREPKLQPTLFYRHCGLVVLSFQGTINALLKASYGAESISGFHACFVSQERQQIDYRFEKK